MDAGDKSDPVPGGSRWTKDENGVDAVADAAALIDGGGGGGEGGPFGVGRRKP